MDDIHSPFVSIAVIYSFYSFRYRCQHLVWYRLKPLGNCGYRQIGAEDFNAVSLVAVDICDINHTDIHTDIAYIGRFLPVDNAVSPAVAEPAVQAVGISYGQCRDARIARQHTLAAVANRLVGRNIVYLQNDALQCRYRLKVPVLPNR